MKRVLFLYGQARSGHQRAAEAVAEAFRRMGAPVAPRMADLASKVYPVFGEIFAHTYLELLRLTPEIWSMLYDNPELEGATRPVRKLLSLFHGLWFLRFLKKYRPEAIVCTHAVPLIVLADLRRRGKIPWPVAAILTDYNAHAYWPVEGVDLYLAPTPQIQQDLRRRGVRPERIAETGVPIHPDFAEPEPPEAARRRLGLDPDRFTLLVMGGSHGFGPMDEILAGLDGLDHGSSFQVIVVCGDNRGLYRRIRSRYAGNGKLRYPLLAHGYTGRVPLLMAAADLFLSKPGGLSASEALARGVPMIITEPLPGQEQANARFLLRTGGAVEANDLRETLLWVRRFLRQPRRLEIMRRQSRPWGRPAACFEAARRILGLLR